MYTLAVQGGTKHPQNPSSVADARTRKKAAIIVQMMAIKLFINRSRVRKELEWEEEAAIEERANLGEWLLWRRPDAQGHG